MIFNSLPPAISPSSSGQIMFSEDEFQRRFTSSFSPIQTAQFTSKVSTIINVGDLWTTSFGNKDNKNVSVDNDEICSKCTPLETPRVRRSRLYLHA